MRSYNETMLTLTAIIITLFAVLLIVLPLLEKYGSEPSPEKMQRISRWIVPLVVLAIVLQLVRYWFG